MEVCKHCKKELVHTEGRRKKEFCNDTCRSNFWYTKNVKDKPKKEAKVVVKDLTKTTHIPQLPTIPDTNYTVDTTIEEQVKELEEKIKVVPPGQYYNRVVASIRGQINKLKNNQ